MVARNRPKYSLNQFAPLSILRMFWKHRGLACLVWLTVTGVAAVIIKALPNIYEAEAIILVDSQKIPEKFVASTVQVSLQDSLSAISKQVMNQQQLRGIADDFHLYEKEKKRKTADELIAQFRRDLTVKMDRGFGGGGRAGAFRIAYQGPDPRVVAGVVSRVTDLFIEENSRTREARAQGTSEFIDARLQEAKRQLDAMEASVSQYKIRYSGQLPQQEASISGVLNRLQSELDACEEAITRARQNKVVIESTLSFAEASLDTAQRAAANAARAGVQPDTGAGDSGRIIPVRASETIRAQLEGARQRYQDGHPEVRRLQNELNGQLAAEQARQSEADGTSPASIDKRAGTESEIRNMTPESAADIGRQRERVHNTKTQLELLDRELETRNQEREQVIANMAAYQSRMETLPIREQQLAAITRDYATAKGNYQSLLDKKLSAQVATEMERSQQSERFTVADPAHVPEKAAKPRRRMLYAASSMSGLAIGLALGLLIELRKNVFLGEWELPSGLQVLGRIGKIETIAEIRRPSRRAANIALVVLGVIECAMDIVRTQTGDWF